MKTFVIRGVMITFFAITGLFGTAATVRFDGMEASVQTNSAEARFREDPWCPPYRGEKPGKYPPNDSGADCQW